MSSLPAADEMYTAFVRRDASYDGIFVTAVRTTRIFCRPSCPARKPHRHNIEFFGSAKEALAHGFRPCKRCRPMRVGGATPVGIDRLLAALDDDPSLRFKDRDLRARGLEPASVRRWFKRNHGMTFHAYQRGRRMARAIGELNRGEAITRTAFESGYESLSGFQEALRQITGRAAGASRSARVVHLSRVLTPLGTMLLGSMDEGVCLLEFVDRPMVETQLRRLLPRLDCTFLPGETEPGCRMQAELEEYFAGRLREFTTPLVLAGTPFQERVWRALTTIGYGETRSYAQQAAMIGSPDAVRAVARANGDNRIAIVVPCHRVIGANGSLTGYGGGLWRKRWLLDLESRTVEPQGVLDLETVRRH